MKKPRIPDGYILLPRAKHPIDDMPSLYRDVWLYILKKASHKNNVDKGYVRGECLISIPELQDALTHYVGYKKVTPSKHQIDNVMRWLRKTSTYTTLYDNEYDTNTAMITTTKTTRGMVVKVHDYAFLQDSKNYEYDTGNDNEDDASTKRVRQQPDTIYKNVKELKQEIKDNTSDLQSNNHNSVSGQFVTGRIVTGQNDPPKNNSIKNNSIKNKNNSAKTCAFESEFNEWWNLYNKKVGKKKSSTKFKSLRKVNDFELIMNGTKAYLNSIEGVDKQYQKDPYTFLNGEHFNDEYFPEHQQTKKSEIDYDKL